MALDAYLQAKTLPANTDFPATPQDDLAQKAQYLEIRGLEEYSAYVISQSTPEVENRDKLWARLDASNNFLGIHAWNGSAWKPAPVTPPSGTTLERPTAPSTGDLFYDTSIRSLIRWTGAQWVTNDGNEGDVKMVAKRTGWIDTLADALEKNPGWIEHEAMRSRSPMGAGQGSGLTDRTVGNDYGVEEVVLTEAQMPPHSHNVTVNVQANDTTGSGRSYTNQEATEGTQVLTSTARGEGDAHANVHPVHVVWFLIKTAN